MEKSTELSIEMYELGKEELIETNGGLVGLGASLILLWCTYLLEHETQLLNGVSDGWNELTGTIKIEYHETKKNS